ncbi:MULTISPECIES: hypothetical protein [Nostoc]|nr:MULTISPECIES: hypothetical protein [Nostoc]MBD2566000.1 hypothetical protein [Nostoc linckia FACHB-391]
MPAPRANAAQFVRSPYSPLGILRQALAQPSLFLINQAVDYATDFLPESERRVAALLVGLLDFLVVVDFLVALAFGCTPIAGGSSLSEGNGSITG